MWGEMWGPFGYVGPLLSYWLVFQIFQVYSIYDVRIKIRRHFCHNWWISIFVGDTYRERLRSIHMSAEKKKMKENKMREKNNVDFFFNNDEKHPSTITGLPKRSFYAYGYIIESGILSRVFGHQMPGISAPASWHRTQYKTKKTGQIMQRRQVATTNVCLYYLPGAALYTRQHRGALSCDECIATSCYFVNLLCVECGNC